MKIAYLASLYPAPSHTFIQREIDALRALGVEIAAFSVRRPKPEDILGQSGLDASTQVRWLLPPRFADLLPALLWALFSRPKRLANTLASSVFKARGSRLKLKWLAYLIEGTVLAYLIERAKAGHLHCHFGNAGSNTAAIAAQIAGVPLSITFHGIDLDEPDLFRHAEKLRQCSFAICISEKGRSQLLESIDPEDAAKVAVIRCGYDLPEEAAVPHRPHDGSLLCVARLSPEKGHMVLLDALALLAARELCFHCTMIGGGPLEGELRERIVMLDLSDRVEMIGAQPPAEVMRRLGQADISVLSSFGEGIPIAIMEAFGHGRPVVATHVGGIPELVREGENGKLVPPRDATALADALEALLHDPALAESMGRNGREAVARLHDPQRAARLLHDRFQRSIGATDSVAHTEQPHRLLQSEAVS